MSERLTIKVFASMLGVSIATVSRAFGGAGRISEKTREHILLEAERQGYAPNFHASSLSGEKKSSIGFFYPEIYTEEPDYFISEVVFGLRKSLNTDRLLEVSAFDENSEQRLLSCREQIKSGRLAAVIVFSGTKGAQELAELAVKCDLPVVLIGKMNTFETNTVLFDCEYGAYLAGKYFKDINRKTPAYVSGYIDHRKKRGFARGFGVPMEGILQVPGGAGFRFGAQAFDVLSRAKNKVDCVLCANDNLAAGLIQRAAEKGVKVPDDLAVIGFDDIAMSRYFVPAISTVSLHLIKIGEGVARLLEQQLSSKIWTVPNEVVPCDLVLRQSS